MPLAKSNSPESLAYLRKSAVPANVAAPIAPPANIESVVAAIPPPNPAPVIQEESGILAFVDSLWAAPTAKARILFNAPKTNFASRNSA